MKRTHMKNILGAIMLLLSVVYTISAVAAVNNPVNPGSTVDEKKCKSAGGTFTKSADGFITKCKYPNGDLITCDARANMCETCDHDTGKPECRNIFSKTNLPGTEISGQAANGLPLVAPKDSVPFEPRPPIGVPQPKPTSPIVAPTKETTKLPHRYDAGIKKHSDNNIIATPLSPNECKQLGGKVLKMNICKGGTACQTRDQYGKQHTVCIKGVWDEIYDDLTGQSKGKPKESVRSSDFNKMTPRTGNTMVAPLTSQECKGLGGKVIFTQKCKEAGHSNACATVDKDGVVRVACINKVAK
jgi:hypothetical protein